MKATSISFAICSFVILMGCTLPASPMRASSITPGTTTSAQTVVSVPLQGSFEGPQTVTPGTPPFATVEVHGEGEATHLGRFQISLPHTVNFATSTASGICTMVAADGSTITADFTGQAQLGPIVSIVEHATITGGTGRFSNISGTFTIHRLFDPAAGWTTGTLTGTLQIVKPAP